jgi:hypothetical protein
MSRIRFQFLYIHICIYHKLYCSSFIVVQFMWFYLCRAADLAMFFYLTTKFLKLLRYSVIGIALFPLVFWCFKANSLLWQIRLWESDLNRVEMTPSHYYDEFPSRVLTIQYLGVICLTSYSHDCIWFSFVWQDVFEAACDYAREWNGLLWEDSKTMRLVVKAEIHMHMREHLRRQK